MFVWGANPDRPDKEAMMRIYVCVKHVPDSAAKITIVGRNRIDETITWLLNPYDENAVEEAARLKRQFEGAEAIAVCVGKADAESTLRSAMAMGADRGILVTASERSLDSMLTARYLKAAIVQDGRPDIIFTGKEAIDSEGFQTMFRLGYALGMPVATNAVAFAIEGRRAVVECEMEAGARQVIEMPLPCVVGAGKGLNKPRYPTLPDIMRARKKAIQQIDCGQLAVDSPQAFMQIVELRPSVQQRKGKILEGPPEEAVSRLIARLREEEKVF
jgi:electron transfer flavoprotein beta subunit